MRLVHKVFSFIVTPSTESLRRLTVRRGAAPGPSDAHYTAGPVFARSLPDKQETDRVRAVGFTIGSTPLG